jgi:hypothetical protein
MRGARSLCLAVAAAALLGTAAAVGAPAGAQGGAELKAPADFAGIADPRQRSVALFTEAGKVLQSPRCVNCHPAGDRPLQGDDGHPHEPWVRRGEAGMGVAGLHCPACHQAANIDVVAITVPGNPKWQLAPLEMAWQGKSLAEICAQVKDPARNGGRSLAQIVEHSAHDELVGWGWSPGAGRTPAPGTQERFGALMQAWAESGAECPAR